MKNSMRLFIRAGNSFLFVVLIGRTHLNTFTYFDDNASLCAVLNDL